MFQNNVLDQRAEKARNYEEAIRLAKKYETIIRSQKEESLNVEIKQGKILKRFKELERFVEMIKELTFSQSTVYFKINLSNILEIYPNLKNSSLPLNFLKNYSKQSKKYVENLEGSLRKFARVKYCLEV